MLIKLLETLCFQHQ